MISQTIKSISSFGAKYLAIGFLFASGVILALLAAYAFQTSSITPLSTGTGTTDAKNTSLNSPMLTKSGGTFDRNYHSLEAIANALGLPSVGGAKRIFLTSTTYNGSLGGVAGADAKCQARATAQSLGGTWKAIISDTTSNAKDRLNINFTTATNLSGEIIASNPFKTGLFSLWKAKTNASNYEIRWPLMQDDTKAYVQGKAFWSNTDKDGAYIGYSYWQ